MKIVLKKEFDTVLFFRQVKEKIADLLMGKTLAEQKQILKDLKNANIKI